MAASLPVPVILIGVPENPAGLHCVDLDFALAARMAVEELAETGHDQVMVVGYPAETMNRDLNFVRRFLDSARETADRNGLPYELIAPVEPGRAGAHVAVERALAGHGQGRLGLVLPNSPTYQPVLTALDARGVVPGRDVSVIALCADAVAQELEPPVTNVSLEPRDVVRRAMRTLFWLLEPTVEGPPSATELVPPHLTRRDTVMPGSQPIGISAG